MRKFLLFVCAAITALTANAQTKIQGESFTVEQLKNSVVNRVSSMPETKVLDKLSNEVAAAPAINDLAGNYIEASNNEFYSCSEATVTVNDNKVTFGISYNSAQFVGTYDAATGKITVDRQAAGVWTDSRGTFTFEFLGLFENPDDKEIYFTNQSTFTVNETGEISCDDIGFVIRVTAFTPATGSSYKEEDIVGANWVVSWETRFMPTNGKMAGLRNIVENSAWTGWQNYSIPVAIEDLDFQVNVFNMCEMGCASIDINDDGTISMPIGQIMQTIPQSYVETYGEYFTIKGVGVDSQGYMFIDNTMTEVKGTISGNTITFDNIFANCSNVTNEGYALWDGYYRLGSTITLDNGNYIGAGIKEIGVTREEKIKNTKTYNIMGQQVNRANAKGLLIRNGKKFIK